MAAVLQKAEGQDRRLRRRAVGERQQQGLGAAEIVHDVGERHRPVDKARPLVGQQAVEGPDRIDGEVCIDGLVVGRLELLAHAVEQMQEPRAVTGARAEGKGAPRCLDGGDQTEVAAVDDFDVGVAEARFGAGQLAGDGFRGRDGRDEVLVPEADDVGVRAYVAMAPLELVHCLGERSLGDVRAVEEGGSHQQAPLNAFDVGGGNGEDPALERGQLLDVLLDAGADIDDGPDDVGVGLERPADADLILDLLDHAQIAVPCHVALGAQVECRLGDASQQLFEVAAFEAEKVDQMDILAAIELAQQHLLMVGIELVAGVGVLDDQVAVGDLGVHLDERPEAFMIDVMGLTDDQKERCRAGSVGEVVAADGNRFPGVADEVVSGAEPALRQPALAVLDRKPVEGPHGRQLLEISGDPPVAHVANPVGLEKGLQWRSRENFAAGRGVYGRGGALDEEAVVDAPAVRLVTDQRVDHDDSEPLRIEMPDELVRQSRFAVSSGRAQDDEGRFRGSRRQHGRNVREFVDPIDELDLLVCLAVRLVCCHAPPPAVCTRISRQSVACHFGAPRFADRGH